MATKIAVLSDTHGLLRPEVLDRIAGCDVIIHGGDINKPEIIDRLKEIAPVYVVRGNNDKEWAENIPESLTFQIEKSRFFVVHNKKFVAKDLYDADVVIYGHSHKYAEQMVDGVLWLNPGSCGKRRFDQEITFAIMTVDGSERAIEKSQFQTPDTFKGLTLHSHCYGGCAIFCPHTCGLMLNAYSMQHKRTPCRSPPVIAETIEIVCKLTWRVKKCVK